MSLPRLRTSSFFSLALGALFVAGLLGAPQESAAKRFKTEFIELELPPGWDCTKEEIDYVCQPDNLTHRSEAIVIVAVKNVNPVDDNFEKYQEVLNESREMRDLLGNNYQSEVKYVRFKEILEKRWIDSLQFGSEIPGFYTRYVASIEGKIAGLVSYSIAESVYAKWSPILEKMLGTMRLRYDPKAFNEAMTATPGSLLGQRASRPGRFAPQSEAPKQLPQGPADFDITTILGILLIVGAVGFFIWKKKQDGESS